MLAVFDNGKYNCKSIIGENKDIIISKVEEGVSVFNEETISFNNKSYIIGDEATKFDFNITKNNIHHKILMYYSLAKNMDKIENFELIVGCPISTYLSPTRQEKYISSISNNNSPIVVDYEGEKIINIQKVIIVPETVGGYINDYEEAKKVIRGVVDIGGLNINAAVYNKCKPMRNKMFTLNMGMHILIKNIQQAILINTEKLIDEQVCEHMLYTKSYNDEKLKIIVDGECFKFVRNIKNTLIKNDWELGLLDMRFIGGGSIVLEDYIKQEFKNCFIEKDIFANCLAFKKFGLAKNGKK